MRNDVATIIGAISLAAASVYSQHADAQELGSPQRIMIASARMNDFRAACEDTSDEVISFYDLANDKSVDFEIRKQTAQSYIRGYFSVLNGQPFLIGTRERACQERLVELMIEHQMMDGLTAILERDAREMGYTLE